MYELVWDFDGMIPTGENWSILKKLCHRHFIYCKYYMDWLGVEPTPTSRGACD